MNDKLKHFIAGAVASLLGAVAGWLLHDLGFPPPWACGFVAAALAGVGKEVWDKSHGGDVSLLDAAATLGGGSVVAAVIAVLS